MKNIGLFFVVLAMSLSAQAEKQLQYCDSAKEYITALEFLRKQAGDQASSVEPKNREIASHVAQYCDGAARRFIHVFRLFAKLNLGAVNALPYAKKAAQVEDDRVRLFIDVLKGLYLKSGLDLSLQESLSIAELYLAPTKLPAKKMAKEFSRMNDFCRSEKGLSRNRVSCARITHEILSVMEDQKQSISKAFIQNYKYLRSDKLFLASFDAIKLSRELVAFGPMAIQTYHRALKYALDEKGLNLQKQEALDFALGMAKNSKLESEHLLKSDTKEGFLFF